MRVFLSLSWLVRALPYFSWARWEQIVSSQSVREELSAGPDITGDTSELSCCPTAGNCWNSWATTSPHQPPPAPNIEDQHCSGEIFSGALYSGYNFVQHTILSFAYIHFNYYIGDSLQQIRNILSLVSKNHQDYEHHCIPAIAQLYKSCMIASWPSQSSGKSLSS